MKYITILSLTELLALVMGSFHTNETAPSVHLSYSSLRQDILSRPVAASRIPPTLETGYKERYALIFGSVVVNVQEFDEINQVMTIQIYLGISWCQPQLSWNASAHDNITRIWVPSGSVWTPVFDVNMGLDESSILNIEGDLEILHDGNVQFGRLQSLTFSCKIDFHRYPFDTQNCSVGFYPRCPPYALPTFYNNLFPKDKLFTPNGQWSLESVDTSMVAFEDIDTTVGQKVYVATYTLIVKRRWLYYGISILFPMVMTSFMIPLVFLVPAKTGEKVSYSVATFTFTAIFLNFISEVMPRGLSQLPYLAMLLIEVLLEGLLGVLASLLVVHMHHRETTQRHMNAQAKTTVFGIPTAPKVEPSMQSLVTKTEVKKVASAGSWKLTSNMLDIFFFFLFNIFQVGFLLVLFLGTQWISQVP